MEYLNQVEVERRVILVEHNLPSGQVFARPSGAIDPVFRGMPEGWKQGIGKLSPVMPGPFQPPLICLDPVTLRLT